MEMDSARIFSSSITSTSDGTRSVSLADWQRDPERRAIAGLAVHADGAAVRLGELLREGQTEAGALRLRRVEDPKDARDLLGHDPGPGVADLGEDPTVAVAVVARTLGARDQREPPAARHRVDRVA